MYTFATLDPRNTPAAKTDNDAILDSGDIYGIEVTVPALAASCNLGNLDPQHTDGLNVSACMAALTCPLPPAGATLVTNRPDADALLAMAVLYCRALGRQFDDEMVYIIDSADCTPRGPWIRGYRPHPMFSAMNWLCMDHRIPLTERVMRLVGILSGYGHQLPSAPAVDNSNSNMTVDDDHDGFVIVHCGGGPGARIGGANGFGYQYAPVVVTINPTFVLQGGQPHLKYGVARWNSDHPMDWEGMLAALRALEPGWGGSSSIVGSTQGQASPLTLAQVVNIVRDHLAS